MFKLPDLPYAYDALTPILSAETLRFHHDKHHAAYVAALNDLLPDGDRRPLEQVIREAPPGKLFNNAAQAWNHAFFWDSMTPDRPAPGSALTAAIAAAFGTLEDLKTRFVAEGVGHFGSGWVWLIVENGALSVISTHDAHGALSRSGVTPLLVCDLWEHAYYLDHQNDRKGFLSAWFDALPNWTLADAQLAAAGGDGTAWRYPDPE